MYGVGIEPWVSRYNLTEAVKEDQARSLAGGESLETRLTVSVSQL
jgi:hypothetical protein